MQSSTNYTGFCWQRWKEKA